MGASGAGKTTLLDVLAGRKTQGVIEVTGVPAVLPEPCSGTTCPSMAPHGERCPPALTMHPLLSIPLLAGRHHAEWPPEAGRRMVPRQRLRGTGLAARLIPSLEPTAAAFGGTPLLGVLLFSSSPDACQQLLTAASSSASPSRSTDRHPHRDRHGARGAALLRPPAPAGVCVGWRHLPVS